MLWLYQEKEKNIRNQNIWIQTLPFSSSMTKLITNLSTSFSIFKITIKLLCWHEPCKCSLKKIFFRSYDCDGYRNTKHLLRFVPLDNPRTHAGYLSNLLYDSASFIWEWMDSINCFYGGMYSKAGLISEVSTRGENEAFFSPNIWLCILFANLSWLESRGCLPLSAPWGGKSMTTCYLRRSLGAQMRKSNLLSGRKNRKRTWLWVVVG